MTSRKAIAGMLGSLGVHVAVIASLVGAPPVELPPPPQDELVAIAVMGTEPLSPQPRELGPGPDEAPAPSPTIEDAPPQAEPPPPVEPRSRPARRDTPAEIPEPDAPPNPPIVPAEPLPGPVAVPVSAGDHASDHEGTSHTPEHDAEAETAGNARAHGSGTSEATGGGRYDASSYGKEIVRLVLHELDLDPVPGLKRSDSIRLVLRVEPDGSLSWPASGRFGFAMVLSTTLGPVRTRAILKRVERASARFPAYPAGLKQRRRQYDIEVTIKFTRSLARG